jgi:hypothetical protein
MGVFALTKEIAKGSELCVTYGKGFWSARGLGAGEGNEECP